MKTYKDTIDRMDSSRFLAANQTLEQKIEEEKRKPEEKNNALILPTETALKKAEEAFALFEKDKEAAKFANVRMIGKARELSRKLLDQIEREPINFTDIYQEVVKQARKALAYDQTRAGAQTAVAVTGGRANGNALSLEDATKRVEVLTNELLAGLPNIEMTIAKFGNCIAEGLSGNMNWRSAVDD